MQPSVFVSYRPLQTQFYVYTYLSRVLWTPFFVSLVMRKTISKYFFQSHVLRRLQCLQSTHKKKKKKNPESKDILFFGRRITFRDAAQFRVAQEILALKKSIGSRQLRLVPVRIRFFGCRDEEHVARCGAAM